MKKWIIQWNAGYGDSYETIEAENYDDALDEAYQYWKEEVESNADYSVIGEWAQYLEDKYL
jgi:hypothetical protein